MKRFYNKLSKPKKIIFLILTIPLSVLIGAATGFMIGMFATKLIPDQCKTEGVSTICQNPFEFIGLVGWEGTTALGFIAGGVLGLVIYLILILRPESKK